MSLVGQDVDSSGGEIEIETFPDHGVEISWKDLLPVFSHSQNVQFGRGDRFIICFPVLIFLLCCSESKSVLTAHLSYLSFLLLNLEVLLPLNNFRTWLEPS